MGALWSQPSHYGHNVTFSCHEPVHTLLYIYLQSDNVLTLQAANIMLRQIIKQSKVTIYSSSQQASLLWELMCHTGSVLPATRQRWHSRLHLSQLRLVHDLATPKGCKANLT